MEQILQNLWNHGIPSSSGEIKKWKRAQIINVLHKVLYSLQELLETEEL